MRADKILAVSRREPAVILASLGANLLSLAVPMAMIHIYDRVIPNQGYETLVTLGIMVLGAVVAEVILRGARSHLLELSAERFERAAYPAAVSALLFADPTREDQASQGNFTEVCPLSTDCGTCTSETVGSIHWTCPSPFCFWASSG